MASIFVGSVQSSVNTTVYASGIISYVKGGSYTNNRGYYSYLEPYANGYRGGYLVLDSGQEIRWFYKDYIPNLEKGDKVVFEGNFINHSHYLLRNYQDNLPTFLVEKYGIIEHKSYKTLRELSELSSTKESGQVCSLFDRGGYLINSDGRKLLFYYTENYKYSKQRLYVGDDVTLYGYYCMDGKYPGGTMRIDYFKYNQNEVICKYNTKNIARHLYDDTEIDVVDVDGSGNVFSKQTCKLSEYQESEKHRRNRALDNYKLFVDAESSKNLGKKL